MSSLGRAEAHGSVDNQYAECVGRAVLQSELTAVFALDERWHIVEFSPVAERMFGRTHDQILGAPFHDLILSPLLRSSSDGNRTHPLLGQGRMIGSRSEQTAVRADGSHFPVELALMPIPGPEPPAFLGFIRDITDRRLADYRLAKSEALLAEAEQLANSGSFERDLRSSAGVWSEGLYRVFGVVQEVPPPSLDAALQRLIHPEDRARVGELLAATLRERRSEFDERMRIIRPDGAERTVEVRGKVVFDDFGEPERLVGTIRDVTEEVVLHRDRDLLSYVVDSSDDAIITKDATGVITSWNRGAERLYGYSADEAIGRPITFLAAPGTVDEQAELTDRAFGGETVHRLETTRRRKDGSEVAVSLTISPVCDDTGRIVSVAVIARDVTERRRYEARLQYLAEHDHLTGLLNRRRFDEELTRELSRATRSGSGGAVLSFDLDGFKAINDSAGHAAGDAVLREVARILTRRLRESDVIARLGGDEFAILLPNSGEAEARAAAEHLLEALHDSAVIVDGAPFRPTASIGVALFPPDEGRSEELMVDADLAMYAAKQQGRDRIVIFSHTEAQAARADAKLSWGQRIRAALAEDGLELYWQVIVDVGTGEPSHGELLLRMRSGGKLLPPLDFLGAAERLGLIHAIDRWVVRSAIRLLTEGTGPARYPLSVNLSGESVAGDPDLLGLIERELTASGVDPAKLIFEVTETAAIANVIEARTFAIGVRRLGCRIALDDFGTGFGSFYHLKHLPVDFIKIDREFVHGLPRSAVDQRLVRAIVDVAQAMRIRTVAESVGDDATIEVLRELGVDFIQGFHVGRPEPVRLPGS